MRRGVLSGQRLLVLLFLVVTGTAAPPEEHVIALKPAWLIDGVQDEPLPGAVVLVRGRLIEAAGPASSVTIPTGATVIDLPGQTLLPGMIDTHSHLYFRYIVGGVQGLIDQETAAPNVQMLTVVRNARVQLLCGITTLRQTGEPHYNDVRLREAIDAGLQVGPRIISAGRLITNSGGHGTSEVGFFDGPDAVRKIVRQNFHKGSEWIKLSQIDLTPETAQMSPEDLKAAIDEAHRLGMKVTVHATGRWGSAMRTAILAGADNLEHARPLNKEMVALMLKHGTTASLTPLVYIGWRPSAQTWHVMDNVARNCNDWLDYLGAEFDAYRRAHPQQETEDRPYEDNEPGRERRDVFQGVKNVQRQYLEAHRAGLPFSLGLDTIFGAIPLEMEFLVEAGIPPIDAIRAGTTVAARLVGRGETLGTIETGKLADIISVEGNPVQEIRNMRRVRFIMKDGERFDTLSWK